MAFHKILGIFFTRKEYYFCSQILLYAIENKTNITLFYPPIYQQCEVYYAIESLKVYRPILT